MALNIHKEVPEMARNTRNTRVVPHPLRIAAESLRNVGHTESLEAILGDRYNTSEYLEQLATVVDRDGNFTCGHSPFAEQTAILLMENGHPVDAAALFQNIVGNENQVLLVDKYPQDGISYSPALASKHGRLGYRGVLRYGEACLKCNREKEAKKLFDELAMRVPAKCTPFLARARFQALECLQKLGVTTLDNKMTIAEALEESKIYVP